MFESPSSLTSIGYGAFLEQNYSGPFAIPDSVTEIGDWAFSFNNISGVVNIPNNITNFGDHVFHSNSNITSFNFIGRSNTNGITLGTDWNVINFNPTTYASYTCSGNACN